MSETTLPSSPSWFSWLKSIDMFGSPIHLHIHKQTEYKTLFSGFLSLIVVVAVIASALTMIIDALYYANINFLATFSFSANKVLALNSTNFIMALQVNDPTFNSSNSLYSVDFQHIMNTGAVVEPLGTVVCNKDYLRLHKAELEGVDVSKMLCPASNFYNIENKEAQYIQLSVKRCQNSTKSSVVCASESDIDAYFSDPKNIKPVSVSLFLTNHVLDMLTPEPDVMYLKKLDFKVPGGILGKQSDLSIYEEVVRVENSVMNTFKRGIEEENSFTLEERILDHIVYAADGTFLEINIKKSELEKKYVRSFTKIEEILAFLGGLAKALVIIVSAIAIPFNNFHYRLAISNEIYEFESRPKIYYQKTPKGQQWRKSSKTFSNLDNFSANKDDPIEEGNLAFNRRLIHNEKVQQYHPFFESLLLRHHRLDYTIREMLKNIFCCKRRNLMIKQDLYRQAQDRLRKDVDIITILRKLQDVDKLKELLLSPDQLELFNYKKPLRIEYLGHLNLINKIPLITKRKRPSDLNIKEDNIMRRSLYLRDKPMDTIEQFKMLFEAYKVVSKDKSSKFNSRLGEMLGPDLLKIFEKLDSDFQSDMATITRKSSQFNRADLEAVIGKNSGVKEDVIKTERSNSEEQAHTFRIISDERLKVPKLYKSATAADDLEEVKKQEDNIHIHVQEPKFPMKESNKIEKSRKSGLSVMSSENFSLKIGAINTSSNL